MAYERGSGGAGGKSSYESTLKEYKRYYEQKHGNGFQNSQLDDPYFSNSKPAGSTMRKTPSRSNPNRKPPPDDPYFNSRKPAGNYMGRQSPQPSYAMKENLGPKWADDTRYESTVRNPQKAPPGLLPPYTAPDTPNVTRQHIENSSVLGGRARGILDYTTTKTDYSQGDDSWALGWYQPPNDEGWRPWNQGVGHIQSRTSIPEVSVHEAIHATQGPVAEPWNMDTSLFGRDMVRDTELLSRQGYTKAGDVLNFVRDHYDTVYPSEVQAYIGAGEWMKPAEVPPWYREKYLSDIWSDSAMSATPPPRPTTPPITAPPAPAPSFPSKYRDEIRNFVSATSIRDKYLKEVRAQSEYPVRWR